MIRTPLYARTDAARKGSPVALVFGVIFGFVAGWGFGAEYFAGYIVE